MHPKTGRIYVTGQNGKDPQEKKGGSGAKTGVMREFYLRSASAMQVSCNPRAQKASTKTGEGEEDPGSSLTWASPSSSRGYDRVVTAIPNHIYGPVRPARSLQLLKGKAPEEHCLVLPAETTAAGDNNYSVCRLTSLFTRSFDELNLKTSIFLSNGLIVN